MPLTTEYLDHYQRHREEIARRLGEFSVVPPEEYLWELCYCLLTPQSRALHAGQVVERLRAEGFPGSGVDPTPILRDPRHYIRFHNQKARWLREAAGREVEIRQTLTDPLLTGADRREWLVANIRGIGWKEASHFLRNIGHFDLAIIDRHVLKHMLRTGALVEIPRSIGRHAYLQLEERFRSLARESDLSLQELDLLFWSLEEGSVRK